MLSPDTAQNKLAQTIKAIYLLDNVYGIEAAQLSTVVCRYVVANCPEALSGNNRLDKT